MQENTYPNTVAKGKLYFYGLVPLSVSDCCLEMRK